MSTLGIAIVGCGFMGRRHLSGYGELKRVGLLRGSIAAVVDVNVSAAEAMADAAQALLGTRPRVYGDLGSAMADDAVGAVDIVTDPRSHRATAVSAMEAQRHVFCEKPITLTVRAASAMIDTAARTGMTLGVGENYRRGGANRLAKAVIDSGMLGRIHLMVQASMGGNDRVVISKWRHMRESGAIGLDMGVHYTDIVEYYLGPVESVWGRATIAEPIRYSEDGSAPIAVTGEDSLIASMRTEGGVSVQFTYLPSGPGTQFWQRSLHGSSGSMTVPPDRTDGDVVVQLGDTTLSGQGLARELGDLYALNEVTVAVLGPDGSGGKGVEWAAVDTGYLAVELHDFIDAVEGRRPPEVDGAAGRRALAVAHAIAESGVAGRQVDVDEVLNGSLRAYQDLIDADGSV